jgi:hypothetical protein
MRTTLIDQQLPLRQNREPTRSDVDPGLLATMVLMRSGELDLRPGPQQTVPKVIGIYAPTVDAYPSRFVLEAGIGAWLFCRDGAPVRNTQGRSTGRRDNGDSEPGEINRDEEPPELGELDEEEGRVIVGFV